MLQSIVLASLYSADGWKRLGFNCLWTINCLSWVRETMRVKVLNKRERNPRNIKFQADTFSWLPFLRIKHLFLLELYAICVLEGKWSVHPAFPTSSLRTYLRVTRCRLRHPRWVEVISAWPSYLSVEFQSTVGLARAAALASLCVHS